MNIVERLKLLRKSRGMNQTEFSRSLGMAQNSYSQIETGKISLGDKNIKLICLAFGVHEEWLRTGKGEMIDNEPIDIDEQELLKLYRSLVPQTKKEVLDHAKRMLDLQEQLIVLQPNNITISPQVVSPVLSTDSTTEKRELKATAEPEPVEEKGTGTDG